MKKTYFMSRLCSLAMALVLLALTGFATWTAVSMDENRAADTHQTQAGQSLDELKQRQRAIIIGTPLVFALGLILLSVFWATLRFYQRKIDETTQAELERLARAALTDNLTDLGNHRAFQEDIHRELEHARRQEETIGLALINVDELKLINDKYGHLYGDRLLSELARLLRDTRISDYAYRLNSDQFAMILPHTSLADTVATMECLRKDAQRCLVDATVSIGISTMSGESDRETLYEQADVALAEAKRRGRNRVVTFEEIRESVSFEPTAKAHALRRLLAEQKVSVAFQPIWDLERGTILSFEALSRPAVEYGFAGPQEAFDIAEKIGRAHELDYVCLQAILARAAAMPPDILLFINLTPQTLAHDLLTGSVLLEAVVSAGLTPDRVVLELTERSIARLDVVVQQAKQLRNLGFQLALDDTGAGNAGLEMLSQLPIDFVKIDCAIVANALSDKIARGVLAGIHTIAREADIYVIAEGIESVEMLDLVREMGTQGVQGYLLGRPSEAIPNNRTLEGRSPFAHAS